MTTCLSLLYWSHAILLVCCSAGSLPSTSRSAEAGTALSPCAKSQPYHDVSLSASEQAKTTTNDVDHELLSWLNDFFVSNPIEIAPERRDDDSPPNSLLVSADVMTTSFSSDIDWNPSTTVYNSVNIPITDSITLENHQLDVSANVMTTSFSSDIDWNLSTTVYNSVNIPITDSITLGDHQLECSQPYLDYFDPYFLEYSSPLLENDSYGIHDTALVGLEAFEPHLQYHHPDLLQQNNQLLNKDDTVFHDADLQPSAASVSDISSKKRKRPSSKWDHIADQILSGFPLSDEQRLKIKDIEENSKSSVLRQSGKDPFPSSDPYPVPLAERLSPHDVPLMAAIYKIYFRSSLPPLIEPGSSHTNRLQQALRRMLEWFRNNCPQTLEEFHQLHPHMSLTYFLTKNYGLRHQKLDQSAIVISNSDSDSASFSQQIRSLIASKGTSIKFTEIRLPIAEQICTYVIREYPLTEEQIKVLDQVKSSPAYTRRIQGEDPFSTKERLFSCLSKRFRSPDLPLVCAIHQLFFGPDLPIPKLCKKARSFEESLWAIVFCFTVHWKASLDKFQGRHLAMPIASFHNKCCKPGSDSCGILEFQKAVVKLSNEELDHIDELCRRTVARFPRSQEHLDRMKEVEKSKATELRDQGLDPFKESRLSLLRKSKKKFTLDDIPFVADLFQHFFGRDIQYRVRLVERTLICQKSLQAMLICFWDHWNGDSEDFRRIHSEFSIMYFSKYSCHGSKKCNAQELAVRYSEKLAQHRLRREQIKKENPSQVANSK